MKDTVDAVVTVIKRITGYEIPAELLPFLVLFAVAAAFLIKFALSIRKSRQNFERISSELNRATQNITGESKRRLDDVVSTLASLTTELEQRMSQRLDTIQLSLQLREEVSAQAPDSTIEMEQPVEAEAKPLTPKTRLDLATGVRNAIVAKWLDGAELTPTEADPHSYAFSGFNAAGDKFDILFQTPYRLAHGDDGRMPFTVEVWFKGYKKLNFEWSSDGAYQLRGFKRGDWFEDIADWKLHSQKVGRKRNATAA